MTQRETVRHWMDAAAHIAVLTGAGVSADAVALRSNIAEDRWLDVRGGHFGCGLPARWSCAGRSPMWRACHHRQPEPTEIDQVAGACLREPAAQCLPLLLELP